MSKKKTQTWIPIFGDVRATSDGMIHLPLAYTNTPQDRRPPGTLAKTDQYFTAGTVSFSCRLNSIQDRVQLVLNQGLEMPILVGLHPNEGAFGVISMRNNQTDQLAVYGHADTLRCDRDYNVRIDVAGSAITLFIDGVEIGTASAVVQRSQLAIFISSDKQLTISNFEATTRASKAFIVMQFSAAFNELYEEVIRPTCEDHGFECVRADDIYNNGLIIEDIARGIKEAALVIADITPDNLNVYYEVGYAHGINKPTILLSDRKRDRLPFDVAGFRTLFYDNTIGGKTTIENRLKEHLKNINA